ncbi:hypothetical protein GE115_07370 [Agromyces sp. CFH 90414]|uniref:Uncharacterized protein n=1 Tax=Agromyces agglutinans TaxID=2662258 RepID=A0A6I2FAC4_9MICO|nr:hypothetical protein [Agromyces agglutinans]MRG59690.1 hypothetical protein [Agromyces agglutinans]
MTRDENAQGTNPAAGGDAGSGGRLDDDDLIRKDVSYSPGSEDETEAKQADPLPEAIEDDDDIDTSRVRAVPGTGGPDDAGDVEVPPGELRLPGRAAD